MTTVTDRIYNFSAGPATIPTEVMLRAQKDLLNFKGTGMSVMEISHRSAEFMEVLMHAEMGVRENLFVPDDYAVLFLPGGATFQFIMAPMNLAQKGKKVDAIDTGVWTQKAIQELERISEYRIAASSEGDQFARLPDLDEIDLNPEASYVHICSNNTVFGTQFQQFPDTGDVPLVADMSSDIFSRPIDIQKFGLIFAGAQKNIGPSGMAVVIIRKDLAERAEKTLPLMMQYRVQIKNNSMYNTPPTFGIYMAGLVMDWIKEQGGVSVLQAKNEEKAALFYQTIDASKLFECPVRAQDRSKMNAFFRVADEGRREALEAQFIKESKAIGMNGLKGHRASGGLRASLYNAMPREGVLALIDFIKDFESRVS